jgi:hypothetical protein
MTARADGTAEAAAPRPGTVIAMVRAVPQRTRRGRAGGVALGDEDDQTSNDDHDTLL